MITLRNESFDADDFDFGSLRNADELRDEFIEILKQFAEVYASVDQDWYDLDDIGYSEIIDYIKSNDDYYDKLQDEYNRVIDDELNSEYAEQADHILYGY